MKRDIDKNVAGSQVEMSVVQNMIHAAGQLQDTVKNVELSQEDKFAVTLHQGKFAEMVPAEPNLGVEFVITSQAEEYVDKFLTKIVSVTEFQGKCAETSQDEMSVAKFLIKNGCVEQ